MKRITTFFLLLSIAIVCLAQKPNLEPQQDKKKPLWGFVNPQTNKWVVKPSYESAEPFKECADGKYRAKVTKKGLQGFLNPDGKVAGAGVVFENIEPMMQGNNLFVTVKGKKGIINPEGVYLLKPEYTSFTPLGTEGYISELKGKKGVVDATGKVLIPAIYTAIDSSDKDVFILDKGGKAGLTSRNGEFIIEPKEYSSVTRFGDYWKIWKGKKVGLFDAKKRSVLVKPDYAQVLEPVFFTGGVVYPVQKSNSKWGALNDIGKDVLKCKNQSLTVFPALKAIKVYRKNVGNRLWFPEKEIFLELSSWKVGREGPFKNIRGEIAKPEYDHPASFYLSPGESISYSWSFESRKKAYDSLPSKKIDIFLDKNDNVIDNVNVQIKKFGSNWLVKTDDDNFIPWKIFSANGDLIKHTRLLGNSLTVAPNQEWVVTDSVIVFKDLREYPYISCGKNLQFIKDEAKNKNPWIAIVDEVPQYNATGYDQVIRSENNSASISKDGKWGLFADGKEIIPCKFSGPISKSKIKGYYEVGNPGSLGLATEDGTQLLPEEYDSFKEWPLEDCIVVEKKGILGIYDLEEKEWYVPLTANYTEINDRGNFYECKKKDGKTVYLDEDFDAFTPKPDFKVHCWLKEDNVFTEMWPKKGVKFEVECYFNKVSCFTIHCAVYDSNGKPARLKNGSYHRSETYKIDPSEKFYSRSLYLGFTESNLMFFNETKDMYFKVWVTNDATGKEIPITGKNKFWFTVIKNGVIIY